MSVADLLENVRFLGARLVLAGDRLRVEAPAGALPAELLETIRDNKAALVEEIHGRRRMCSGVVEHAIETVAGEYWAGCFDALRPEQREAVRRAERALDSAALAGDVPATDRCASDFIAAWRHALADRDLAGEILRLTVDEWCARPDKPTIVLDTPHGQVLFVADRDAHARALEAAQVVFSPLEVERLALADREKLAGSDFARKLIETKRAFPAAHVEDVRTGEACRTGQVPAKTQGTGDGDASGTDSRKRER